MSVRMAFFLVFAALISLLAGLVFVMSLLIGNQGEVAASEQRRYEAFAIANQLEEISNNLTWMTRGFAASGNPNFERFFFAILDIRDGKRPWPQGYDRFSFWSTALLNGEMPSDSATPPESMEERVERIGLVELEREALNHAAEASEQLVFLEQTAINAVKGRFDDGQGGFVIREPDPGFASKILYDERYHQAQNNFMTAIDEFLSQVDARVSSEVDFLRKRGRSYANIALLASLVIVTLSMLSFFLLNRKVNVPVRKLMLGAQQIREGDFDVNFEPASEDELGELGKAFTSMAASLAEDRASLKRVVGELRNSEEKYRRLVENLENEYFFYSHDDQGRLTYLSPSVTGILGYGMEIIGQPFANYLTDNPVNEIVPNNQKRLARGESLPTHEIEFHHADGSAHTLEIVSVPRMNDDGTLLAVEGIARDITSRKKAERAIRESTLALHHEMAERKRSEMQLRAALEGMSDGIVVTDADYQVLLFNQQTIEIMDYPDTFYHVGIGMDEILRFHAKRGDLGAGNIGAIIDDEMQKLRSDQNGIAEYRLADDRVIQVRRNSLPDAGFIFIYSDITSRKQYEKALERARDAAESANRAKSQFLSNMSHELRTPLNGVLGYTQILLRDRDLTDNQKDNLEAVESCGQHLLTLINDVLDLSKIESGRLDINPTPCDLSKLAEGVVDMVRQRGEQKNLDVELVFDDDIPSIVMIDIVKLKQILVNLMGNAVKFTHEGLVGLRVSLADAHTLQFAVKDTGHGIANYELETIFNPFVQAAQGKTAGGTGLGLAISQRLARAMNGDIEVSSVLGVGSTFTLRMPFQRAAAESVVTKELATSFSSELPRLAPDQSVTILVADDRPTNRDVLAKMLNAAGFHTATADNGLTALQILREQAVPLVLMDIRMPVMDGLEATRAIKSNPELNSIIVIAVTASVFPEMRQELIDAGCDDFIAKPIQAEEVFSKLQRYLNLRWAEDVEARPALGTEPTSAEGPGAYGLAELLPRLADAADLGDLGALREVIKELQASGEAGQALAEQVSAMSREFDFAAIKQLAVSREERSDA
jgi:PAS domain S-box-containing protein